MKTPSQIIVQAGGKGTRLGHLTQNKPKCLVSIHGKPLLYHLFSLYPESTFQVIGDYKSDVLETYLATVTPKCKFNYIKASGTGTGSGISQALKNISDNEDILLIWCDLFLAENYLDFEGLKADSPQIGLSRSFSCRWSLNKNNKLVHEASDQRGVAGFFRFPDKSFISDIPESAEFVRWLSHKNLNFQTVFLDKALELGTIKAYEEVQSTQNHTRFFNQLEYQADRVIKRCVEPEYDHLIFNECHWYQYIQSQKYQQIPQIYSTEPLTLEKMDGYHPFEVDSHDLSQIKKILHSAIKALQELHQLDEQSISVECVKSNYIHKTRNRVESIAPLINGYELETITVNGLECRNPFHKRHSWIFEQAEEYLLKTQASFRPIHGDPTFSNMLYSKSRAEIVLLDPRGYFGKTKICGDPDYDWAKLYYSVVGNYDEFNRRQFVLYDHGIGDYVVYLQPSRYRQIASELTKQLSNPCRIELLHALIWLALTSYASDDIDSIRAAFYLGIYYLEKTLIKYNWLEMSCLSKTWFVDVDGVLVKHNGHLNGGDQWLDNTLEFLHNISQEDRIILTTSRKQKDINSLLEELKSKGIKIYSVITELPHGERTIINDRKSSGLRTAFSISLDRDAGTKDVIIANNSIL
jgi:thiamine kinase-like enzyme